MLWRKPGAADRILPGHRRRRGDSGNSRPHLADNLWLQLAVQGILDDEVPWYECVTPLTSGAEGAVVLLAKHFLAISCLYRAKLA